MNCRLPLFLSKLEAWPTRIRGHVLHSYQSKNDGIERWWQPTCTYLSHRDLNNKSRNRLEVTKAQYLKTKKVVKAQFEGIRENVFTIPNGLSMMRICLTPVLGYAVVNSHYYWSLSLFAVAGISDLLDGMIARRYPSQSSTLGSWLDPMADKFLIATLFATLSWVDLIPLVLTCLIISRDLILVVAGFVIRYKSLPEPKTLSRYFDFSMATAQLSPTFLSKLNTTVQLVLVGSTLAAPVLNCVDHPILQCLWYMTASTTILSGLGYLISKNTFKYVRHKSVK